MADSETHVAVSHEGGEEEHTEHEEAAAAAVATAGAAVALAHETAAHAELQAAEEVAEIEEEVDEWRSQQAEAVSSLSANLLTMNERLEQLGQLEELRHQRDAEMSARLEALEAHPSLRLTPPASEAEAEETPTEMGETETETQEQPLVGTEASANVGPAEVAGSASLANPIPSEREPERPKRKRHWI